MAPYYDDYGNEINPDLIPTPGLCLICKKNDDPSEEVLCTLNRMDQADNNEDFKCYAFENI